MLLRKSFLAVAVAMGCLGSEPGIAGEPLTVTLDSGQTLQGELDERTDEKTMWLRREEAGIRLTTAIPWARVDSAEREDAVIQAVQLRAEREAYVTPATAFFAGNQGVADEGGDWQFVERRMSGIDEQRANVNGARRARVTSLQIVDVYAANLDRDGSIDGLIVRVAALDDAGSPVPVRGSLRAQLWTQRRPWREPGGGEFAAEETWSQALTAGDFVDGVATLQLPFRHLEPEAEFDLLPDAELVVRLTAFGSGNFEANAPICLRPYDRFRDRLQETEGTRYVPRELPGRMGRQRFDDTAGRWMGWP